MRQCKFLPAPKTIWRSDVITIYYVGRIWGIYKTAKMLMSHGLFTGGGSYINNGIFLVLIEKLVIKYSKLPQISACYTLSGNSSSFSLIIKRVLENKRSFFATNISTNCRTLNLRPHVYYLRSVDYMPKFVK